MVVSGMDDWSKAGTNILAPELLAAIQRVLDRQPIILEHRLYRASTAPLRIIFEGYDDFLRHLESRAKPGDRILVWGYSDQCRDDNKLAEGKYPDAEGRTPREGTY